MAKELNIHKQYAYWSEKQLQLVLINADNLLNIKENINDKNLHRTIQNILEKKLNFTTLPLSRARDTTIQKLSKLTCRTLSGMKETMALHPRKDLTAITVKLDGEYIGWSLVHLINESEAYIQIFVKQKYRGLKIGSNLLYAAQKYAKRKDKNTILVSPRNKTGEKFFVKYNFYKKSEEFYLKNI